MNTVEAISNTDRILIDHIRARTAAGTPDAETNRDCNYAAGILLIQAKHLENTSRAIVDHSLELYGMVNKNLKN